MHEPTYSFVIPLCNEEAVLAELHRRLDAVSQSLDGASEFIMVDDGSADDTRRELLKLRDRDSRVKVVALSRNFGHQMAISAGLDFAGGKAVVIMDGDLQDPPELVPKMIARWREGFDVVHATRSALLGEGKLRRVLKSLSYRLLRRASPHNLRVNTGDFRLVDRRVVEIVRNMHETNPYLRGTFAWVGFRQTEVHFDRPERFAGDPKYNLPRLAALAVDGMVGFSVAPLRFALALGFLISSLSFAAAAIVAVLQLSGTSNPPGWTSLMVLVSFLAGIQLIILGVMGLYVGQISEQGRGRPRYLIAEAHGLSSEAARSAPQRIGLR